MGIKKASWKKLGAGLFIAGAIFSFFSLPTKAADQSDAIGVRVMPNPNHSSIYNWYVQQGFKGSPQSLIVDGYEAIRDGRTVFVNAANVDTTNRKLYTNVYLISYNQESAVKTVDILGQLISHWKFNSNIPTVGQCSISNKNCQADSDCSKDYICSNLASSSSQGKCILKDNKQCLTDSDCPVNLFCDSLKAKVTRDVKRLGSLDQIKSALNSFKSNNGGYPSLQSGTYISGTSLSLWPSWQENFWPQIKLSQLLVDPINVLGYCAGYDATTCWNKDTNAFVSPELVLPYGSYAFLYKAASNGVNYDLCAVFESKIAGIDTAEGKFTSNSCAVGEGYGGLNSNTAPTLVSFYTDGETGKEFNGYLKAKDLEGDTILWNLSPITPVANWINWSDLPTLKDSGDINQKKISALKVGNPGVYKMLLKLSDSRGASATSEITFNIGAAGKPLIEADNVDYFVDPINPLKYTFYVQGSNSIPTYTFLPINPGENKAINSNIANAAITLTKIGSNRVKVDLSILFPTSTSIPKDITIPYQIVATANGSSATHDININLKMEQPYLDFQCENMARTGQPYQISNTGFMRSCLLGGLKSGNHSLTYSVTGPTNLVIRTDSSNAYLEALSISSETVDNEVKVKVANKYGATAEKTFNLKINTFCGDGLKQKPNSEGRGGLYNDGTEQCDGAEGTITNGISTSSDIQYGCTTGFQVPSPYPILDNNSCVFKPADNGGGYCGDGLCQFQILVDGQSKNMENCWNCLQDCGSCVATIVSSADQGGHNFTFYVSPTGNDSNAGTSASPFKTIQKGVNVAAAGDTVLVKAGTYPEYVRFHNSGTVGEPITLKNYNTDVVTIDAQNTRVYSLYLGSISNIVIDGINVKNATNYNIFTTGVTNITIKNFVASLPVNPTATNENMILEGAAPVWDDNITVQNFTMTGGRVGIMVNRQIRNVNIIGGEISNSSESGMNIGVDGLVNPSAADLLISPHNIVVDGVYSHNNGISGIGTRICMDITIRNSHLSYNGGTGIQIEKDTIGSLLENNLAEYNSRNGTLYNYETGIWVYNSKDSIIRRNTIKGNQTGLRISKVNNFQAYNNLIINNNYKSIQTQNTSGVDFSESSGTFYNNTLIGNSASDSKLGSLHVFPVDASNGNFTPNNITIKNNIIMNDGSSKDMDFDQLAGSVVISDNNLVYNTNRPTNIQVGDTNYNWSNYKLATGQDSHSIDANPLFVSTTDFHLKSTSPAINAGANVGLTGDYLGNSPVGLPDIGAYEYQVPST